MRIFISVTCFLGVLCVHFAYGQLLMTGCPTGWEAHQTNCYKFEKDAPLIFEDADAECWVTGATLLKVDSVTEHTFINKWLLTHDAGRPSVWFTGGSYQDGTVHWQGETTRTSTTSDLDQNMNPLQFWLAGKPPQSTTNENRYNTHYVRIAYTYGSKGLLSAYGWVVVSPSIPSAYICEIPKTQTIETRILERTFDYGLGMVQAADIEKGPVMDEQPQSVVIYPGTPTVYLQCGVHANPPPSFSWARSYGNRRTEVTSKTDPRYTTSGNRITIQEPDAQKDEGTYKCVAENKYGKLMSDPADVIFGYLQSFSPVRPDDVIANKFEGTRISCQAPSAFPEVRYTWYQLSQGEMMPIFEDHNYMFISYSGYLYFSEVQPTDNRKYYCMVTLSASSRFKEAINQPPIRTSLGVWLYVSGSEHGVIKPYLYTHVFPSPALKGSRIRIECIAYGTLPLIYSWYREDGRQFVEGTHLSDSNRVLTIENANIDAEGNYVCRVRGRRDVTKKIINLIIEAKPYFPFGIGNKFADPDQKLFWRCKAVARPKATYSWYKDGQLLNTIPGQMEVTSSYLLINKVDADRDQGMYQCGATNVHGTTYSSGQLKVLSFPPNFNRFPLPPKTLLPLGGNYTIPCRVEGAPIPEVVWMKNGGSLGVMPGDLLGRVGMTFENDLVLTAIAYSDQGMYTCKGTNINGEAINSTQVQVIRGISIMRPPANAKVMVNTTAFMYCQASYDSQNFDLTYQWRFNGHIIDTHHSPHFIPSKKAGLDGLYISQAQFEHNGMFTCDAKTPIHTESASAYLTVVGPPAAPAGTYVHSTSVTSHSVRLIWTVTTQMSRGSPVSKYDIEAEVNFYPGRWDAIATDVMEFTASTDATNFGLRPDQRTAVIEGLLPDIDYRFRVRAINMYGKGLRTSKPSAMIKTPARAPVTPVKRVRGIDDAKVGTLTIVWDPLDIKERAGPDVGYNVYFKQKDDNKDFLKVPVHGADEYTITHTVGEDNYYMPYTVKVGVFNKFGPGPNTSTTTVMSAEGMPVSAVLMGDCDNYNGTAFSMSWTPIEDTRENLKGRLKGYRIRYYEKDYDDQVVWRDLYGQHDSTVIIGLKDNTNYWASVQVMNYAGVGPQGEIRLAETFHLPPMQYPRHVKVYSHSKHSVKVRWQGVSTDWDEETLQGYIIRVWKIQEDIRSATDTLTDKRTEGIVRDLQAHTVYVLRVLGRSIGGDGALSPHVYFTVEGGNIPFDPVTTQYCFDVDRRMCEKLSGVSIQISLFALVFSCLYHVLLS